VRGALPLMPTSFLSDVHYWHYHADSLAAHYRRALRRLLPGVTSPVSASMFNSAALRLLQLPNFSAT